VGAAAGREPLVSTLQILRDLRALGAVLKRDGDRLILRAERRPIPQFLVERARAAKKELLMALDAEAARAIQTPPTQNAEPTTQIFLTAFKNGASESRVNSRNFEDFKDRRPQNGSGGLQNLERKTAASAGLEDAPLLEETEDFRRFWQIEPTDNLLDNGADRKERQNGREGWRSLKSPGFVRHSEANFLKAANKFCGVEEAPGAEPTFSGPMGPYETSNYATINYEHLVFCDFETRNIGGCDLTKAGSWRYAADTMTEILCFGYRVGGADHLWTSARNNPEPLASLAADPSVHFVSFAGFEPVIWQLVMTARHGFAPIPIERWIDLRACAVISPCRANSKRYCRYSESRSLKTWPGKSSSKAFQSSTGKESTRK
jgi:hypothetical protein